MVIVWGKDRHDISILTSGDIRAVGSSPSDIRLHEFTRAGQLHSGQLYCLAAPGLPVLILSSGYCSCGVPRVSSWVSSGFFAFLPLPKNKSDLVMLKCECVCIVPCDLRCILALCLVCWDRLWILNSSNHDKAVTEAG